MDVHLSVHEPEGYRLVSNQGLVMTLGIGYALLMVSEEERTRMSKRGRIKVTISGYSPSVGESPPDVRHAPVFVF